MKSIISLLLDIVSNKNGGFELDEDNSIFLEKEDDDIVERFPAKCKLFVCVEGENDKKFLNNIGQIPELKEIIDISSEQIVIFPMEGRNLQNLVQGDYLKDLNVIQFHLYDRDDDKKYEGDIKKVNSRADFSYGVLTKKREIENYIHPNIISEHDKFKAVDVTEIKDWDNYNIPFLLAQKTNLGKQAVKSILCGQLSKRMTKEKLEAIGAWSEVEGWFKKIKQLSKKKVKIKH